MKRKLLHTLLSVTLGAGVLAIGGAPTQAKSQNKEMDNTYAIAFKSGLPENYQEIIRKAGGKVTKVLPEVGGIEAQSDQPSFLKSLKGIPSIEAANREIPLTLDKTTVRPYNYESSIISQQNSEDYTDSQWDIQRVTNNGKSYNLETGGYKNKDGSITHKAVVGVIDTGIDESHPDLTNNIVGGRNLVPAGMDESETGDPTDIKDRNGHGTHVAGIIGANGKVKGVGPELGIRSYRVFYSEQALGLPSWIIDGIIAATNDKVDVINMSLRFYNSNKMTVEGESYKSIAETLLWKRAIQYAVKNGVTVVAGSGNESLNLDNKKEVNEFLTNMYEPYGISVKGPATVVPAQMPGVINVSASTKWSTQQLAFYSNYGNSAIDVSAPGGDYGQKYAETNDPAAADPSNLILSTWPTYLGTSYELNAGTSMATPQVAGIAGVIKAAHPEYKPAQITARIKQTAFDYGKKGHDALFGSGEANAYRALENIKK
ncbi:S8 family serine peptidase [Priestia aryabhattai]|uniref:S8 family serine peptidase n=1 Tax=Priestia aryabhattai TaxID=412384 RepID=UPI0024529115|nr:S8 family serine peptidase [Priestia aryabhattai]MBZ6488506.1 S8 family serine peptidase [Priestia aryabhattai]MDH3111120.1 S8 family serine peptidase [Priestia aryabhattai]MDH3129789.1 S8 family serine peptidase [Priestia aryabhattai]MDH3130265.1 S8 family serine peptidase [Priestia aryabhattai]